MGCPVSYFLKICTIQDDGLEFIHERDLLRFKVERKDKSYELQLQQIFQSSLVELFGAICVDLGSCADIPQGIRCKVLGLERLTNRKGLLEPYGACDR